MLESRYAKASRLLGVFVVVAPVSRSLAFIRATSGALAYFASWDMSAMRPLVALMHDCDIAHGEEGRGVATKAGGARESAPLLLPLPRAPFPWLCRIPCLYALALPVSALLSLIARRHKPPLPTRMKARIAVILALCPGLPPSASIVRLSTNKSGQFFFYTFCIDKRPPNMLY